MQQDRISVGAARETQIHGAYTRVEILTRDLEALTSQLEDRLASCLNPSKPETRPGNPTPPQPVRAPLANGLEAIADALENMRDRLRNVIGRVEL